MRAKSENRPITTIIVTIIISSVILASSTYLFYYYLIPLYNIDMNELYALLVRLLPIIIGLLLTIISLVLAPVYIPATSSKDDELMRDAITAPLYNLPDEEKTPIRLDETDQVQPSPIQASVVNKTVSPVETPYVTSLETVAPPYNEDVAFLLEDPVPITVVKETAFVEKEEIVLSTPTYLDREVDFSAYPFSIHRGSDIASLLEPIEKSTPVDLDHYSELTQTVEDSLMSRLEEEIESAVTHNYPLSVAIFVQKLDTIYDSSITDTMIERLDHLAHVYVDDNENINAIYPFYSYRQSQMSIASSMKSIKKLYPEHSFSVGFTSLGEENADSNLLLSEVHIALELATEQATDSIIGFESV